MPLCEEVHDVAEGVPIETLKATGWEAHGQDTVSDVGDVQVIAVLFVTVAFAADEGT